MDFKRTLWVAVKTRLPHVEVMGCFLHWIPAVYIQANWVYSTTFPSKNWSISGQPVRTNNDVEGWHNTLNRHASGRPEIPFYQMVELLLMEAQLVELQMQLVAHQKLSRNQRKKYHNHQKKIFNLWGKYSDGEKSVDQLQKVISFINGPIMRQC